MFLEGWSTEFFDHRLLVHFTELPDNYVVSVIAIPDPVSIEVIAKRRLPKGWNKASGSTAARAFGKKWVEEARSAVLAVPSSIVAKERLLILNPAHRDFSQIEFGKPVRHVFDPRLR